MSRADDPNADSAFDPNALVQALADARYGHLQRRLCTAEEPMALADKDRFRWGHPDAVSQGPFFNLERFLCPHCTLMFTCVPAPLGQGQARH